MVRVEALCSLFSSLQQQFTNQSFLHNITIVSSIDNLRRFTKGEREKLKMSVCEREKDLFAFLP